MKLTDMKKLKVNELRSRLKDLGLDNKGLKTELLGRLWSALEAGHCGEELHLHEDRSLTPTAEEASSPPTGAGVKPDCTDRATQTETHTSLPSQHQGSGSTSSQHQVSGSTSSQHQGSESISSQHQGSESISSQHQVSESTSSQHQGSGSTSSQHQGSESTSSQHQVSESISSQHQGSESTSSQHQGSESTSSQHQGSESTSSQHQGSESTSSQHQGSESTSSQHQGSESTSSQHQGSESTSSQHQGSESISEAAPVHQAGGREAELQQGGAEDPGEDRRTLSSDEMGRGRAFYEFKEEIRYKRTKSTQPPVDREETETEKEDEDKVRLDPHDSHLHFEVGPDGACGQPRFWARFPSLWSGCRLTHGVLQGKVGFEVRLERKLLTTQLEEPVDMDPCGLRVGWSLANTSLLLGEDNCSFAFDGRGKKVSGGKEEAFGELLSEGDIIGCYASFSTDGAVELSFHKNGRVMGEAFSLEASVLLCRPLFPHVLCKSCSVRVLLDPTAPPWYPGPPEFTPLTALSAWQRVRTTLPPASRAQCEVVLMVGLPGSGKSHWARTHMKQHPEERYKLLGTEELLACMISDGQRNSRLQQASQCLTDLIKMAAQTPGNYILDQCNILFSARRYKLQLFTGFRRRVVVVFPSADEWKRRLSRHQMDNGEQIPETALLKLQVSCSLPEQHSSLLEELQYVELPQEQAQTLLQEYSDEARRLLPPIHKQEKKKTRLHKKRPHPHGPPPSHRIQWTGLHGWNDTRHNMQPWRQQPRYWSVPHQDPGCYYRDVGYSGYEGYW